jgi:hypothetical protein
MVKHSTGAERAAVGWRKATTTTTTTKKQSNVRFLGREASSSVFAREKEQKITQTMLNYNIVEPKKKYAWKGLIDNLVDFLIWFNWKIYKAIYLYGWVNDLAGFICSIFIGVVKFYPVKFNEGLTHFILTNDMGVYRVVMLLIKGFLSDEILSPIKLSSDVGQTIVTHP